MKFRKWRKKLSGDCARAADRWLSVASVSVAANIINFLCMLGNIETELSVRTLFLQLAVFGVCMGVTVSCVLVSWANNEKAVRIKEGGLK